MANLKELRTKIGVVQSIRKVTAAMKLVAGVKLRKAEQKASASREYAAELGHILSKIRRELLNVNCELFSGREEVNAETLIVFASDKGLCGNFNYLINKEARGQISKIQAEGKRVRVICVGGKPFNLLKKTLRDEDSIELANDFYKGDNLFENSKKLAEKIVEEFTTGVTDKVSVVYTRCFSVMRREIEIKSVIPLICEPNSDKTETIFEPSAEYVLKTVVPYNIAIQIYQSALESVAGEQGSRMTSMDNATRNADELLSNLTITYNRTRQHNITQELVEVVSGAAAIAEG
ncbi:MAG: ATP synthase F1 subunit gamma [Holosporaceae bacterium]|jgi:F-type H+-transporting ATPase subunit gamma|nr:ATP synthase F1 subunit gamma [Holosporaceae bacterium]